MALAASQNNVGDLNKGVDWVRMTQRMSEILDKKYPLKISSFSL